MRQEFHKFFLLFIVSGIVFCLFLLLSYNNSSRFREFDENCREKSAIVLERGVNTEDLAGVLYLHNYVSDTADAEFVAEYIEKQFEKMTEGNLSSLYEMNKRIWQIPAHVIDSIGSKDYKNKLIVSRENLGITSEIDSFYNENCLKSIGTDTVLTNDGEGCIIVKVQKEEDTKGSGKFGGAKKIACPSVVVGLSQHFMDSDNNPQDSILCYLKTNLAGEAVFDGLDENGYYSVLPIKNGYEYGTSKGTVGKNLGDCSKRKLFGKSYKPYRCSFIEKEHRIRIFDEPVFRQIRGDHTIAVRSPEDFKHQVAWYLVVFFALWWGLYFISKIRHRNIDVGILSMLMFLTGFCLLIMFSINDPLIDKMLGSDMAKGVIIGIIVIVCLQFVDFVKFYQNRAPIKFDLLPEIVKWLFKPYRDKVSRLTVVMSNRQANIIHKLFALLCCVACLPFLLFDLLKITKFSPKIDTFMNKLPKGMGYLLTALFLTLLLFTPFGSAVGGMKVNLNLGFIKFQPGEIAKLLMIVFMAAFFSLNADKIVKYSMRGNVTRKLLWHKFKMLMGILGGLAVLIVIYAILGDLGPGLVLALTFIFMYSTIKSKVDLENKDERKNIKRILSCDLAMLVYGIISFVVFLLAGSRLELMGVFCAVWFFVWIVGGIVKKQVFESAIFFNLVIAVFIFGGSIFSNLPGLAGTAERFKIRTEMCTNTWGELGMDEHGIQNDMEVRAGRNTQVAEGLWGLASGGFAGQGLGNGSPNMIPAFHTDMILETIGEETGFIGVFAIVFLMALLLRKSIIAGYKTKHPFVFYLCLGIAIVTGVQFLIIALGSLGMMPLTGITMPFLSYGNVSMILNLAAFGIVLSISGQNNIAAEENRIIELKNKNIGTYNYTVSILSWIYVISTFVVLCVFCYYQIITRNKTLIRPVYVYNSCGMPVIQYNPRIAQLTALLQAGNIYDRNGVLLATSNKAKLAEYKDVYDKYELMSDTIKRQYRYYPFAEHLYFMLGDYNTKLFFSSSDKNPRGYMAEVRHLTELRGYDNILRNRQGNPIQVDLYSDKYHSNRYLSANDTIILHHVQLRDYSQLIPYLKAGAHSDKIKRVNIRHQHFWETGEIKPKDIQLTVDACLQTELQNELIHTQKLKYNDPKKWNKLRISVVVLDAINGDLLASAVYPLPDYEQLKSTPNGYSDSRISKAYTDCDLGLTYPTAPGSTAKIMSALAGMRKMGANRATQCVYNVDKSEKIYSGEPGGTVTMRKAVVRSSNCYFINLVNDNNLYDDLDTIYRTVGVQLNGKMPYCLHYVPDRIWGNYIAKEGKMGVRVYKNYKSSGKKEKMNKTGSWSWAWGQGTLAATPLSMARVASIVVNKGSMPQTHYLLRDEKEEIDVIPSDGSDSLYLYMKEEAKNHSRFNENYIGGKTGTAERSYGRGKQNDGWYICFIDNARIRQKEVINEKGNVMDGRENVRIAPIAIAVRMERLGGYGSGKAVNLTKDVVIPILEDLGYIE